MGTVSLISTGLAEDSAREALDGFVSALATFERDACEVVGNLPR